MIRSPHPRLISLFAALLVIGSFVASVTTVWAQHHYTPSERRIITLVDEERGADSVADYLHDKNPDVAWRAAVGLANLRDTTVRPALIRAFESERRDTVMDAEAFALGVLGQNEAAAHALTDRAATRPSLQILRAIGRTASSSAEVCGSFRDKAKANAWMQPAISAMLVEFGLRQHYSEPLGQLIDLLGESVDPTVRWRAAYTFARLKDSAAIAKHLPILQELLNDQGSEYARMFAATSIGRIGSPESKRVIETALKSEPAWRVRVNLFNAVSRSGMFDSVIFGELRKTVDASTNDDGPATNLATSALRSVDQMITDGKLTRSDSLALGTWLSEYNGMDPDHSEVPKLVQATASVLAARLNVTDSRAGIENFAQMKDYVLRNLAVEGGSVIKDTFYFGGILASMPYSSPKEQLNRLEALANLWDLAKRDPRFMSQLEAAQLAPVYRHLVLHIPELVYEPEVVIPALSAWSDSTILNSPTLRSEAATLLAGYIRNYLRPDYRDQLVAAATASISVGASTPELKDALKQAAPLAAQWSDRELLDTLKHAYQAVGLTWPGLKPAPGVSAIDWNTLESLPNSMIINFTRDNIELQLLPYFAPLTTLAMVHLAKIQYFANQTFHRVVPNFVVQSGDPTGSGWGGPGYTMRTEISPLAYDDEGWVGMASSGLNTEGSQWFITECPTPHLTTHYTIWAKVRKGMDKVYQILPGDKLETIQPYNSK